MSDVKLETLAAILDTIVEYSSGWIYLQDEYPWTTETLGFILETSRYGEPKFEDVYPDAPEEYGLRKIISLSIIKEVIFNATSQKDDVRSQELVDCFNHYYAYDGFLNLLNK